MSGETADQVYSVKQGTIETISVNLSGYLDSGETVSAISGVTGSPSGLSFSSQAVNSSTLQILSNSVAAGKAAQVTVDTSGVTFAAGTSTKTFTISIAFTKSSSPTPTRYVNCILEVYQ